MFVSALCVYSNMIIFVLYIYTTFQIAAHNYTHMSVNQEWKDKKEEEE